MKCKSIRKHLSAWQDGELNPELRRIVEAHLESCSECRFELAALEQLAADLHRIPPPPISPGFSARVMTRIKHGPRRQTNWLPSLAYSALFLVVFGLGIWVITPRPAVVPQSQPILRISLEDALLDTQNAQLASVQDGMIDLFKGDAR